MDSWMMNGMPACLFFCCLVVHETSNVWKECASLQAQRLRVTVRRPTYPVPMAK